MDIVVKRKQVMRYFFAVISLLLTAHIGGLIWTKVLGFDTHLYLIQQFNINLEGNIPTWYASSALLVSAFLLLIIALAKKKLNDRYAVHWMVLALIFIFLSCDESAQLHEMTVSHVHNLLDSTFFQFIGWVIPYSIILILFTISYLKFFLSLPKRVRLLFAGSGLMFLGGALGMEIISGPLQRTLGRESTFLLEIIEELLEMGGIAFFIYANLSYIAWHLGDLNIRIVTEAQPAKESEMM